MISLFASLFVFLQLPNFRLPEQPPLPPITREAQITYLDRNGAVIGVRGGRYGPPVDVTKLPAYVPAAFVAIEDRRFYQHNGVDPRGIGRAIVTNITEGRMAEGASTITQQLVKNVFLTPDQTLERKAREAAMALQLEQKYSKREILGLYLSRVYYGGGAYGLEAASQRYFGKPAARLTIKEAAILAGTLKSPTAYNPAEYPKAANDRAALVLAAMVETGAITPAQQAAALKENPRILARGPASSAGYFLDWVDAETRKVMGTIRQDIVVETTLDLPLNTTATQAVTDAVGRFKNVPSAQSAIVAVDNLGKVRAMVGGSDHIKAPYNRAVLAKRQAGSAWKPFVYLAALEAGKTPETPVVDQPVTIGNWTPVNYTPGYSGEMSLQRALSQSINTVAASLAYEVGTDKVADAAQRAGITSAIDRNPAMALGTTGVSPLEMAAAYAAFANGGNRVTPYGIERIRSTSGAVLYQARPPPPVHAIDNPALSDLNRMLRAVVTEGTGTRAKVQGYDIAGKTGTTSDYKDAWFVGHTGGLAMAVWLGRDDNQPLGTTTGGTVPAETWQKVMSAAVKRLPTTPIPSGPPPPAPPPFTVEALLNDLRGGPPPPPSPVVQAPVLEPVR